MIEGLDLLLANQGQPRVLTLRNRLNEFISENHGSGQLIMQERIKSQVYRLHFELEDHLLTLILKCLEGRIAHRNELVSRRWLPAVGLAKAGPPLLTTAGTPDGQFVWHIYSDLGSTAPTVARALGASSRFRFVFCNRNLHRQRRSNGVS